MSYLHPGVYLEEISSGVKPIEGVATSVAAFVGASSGGLLGVPTLLGSFEQFQTAFGALARADDAMALAALAFFNNGGKSAYFLRVNADTAAPTTLEYQAAFDRLRTVRDVRILVLPGQAVAADGSGNPVVSAAITHCEAMRDRMLLVDPPAGLELKDGEGVDALKLPTSTYTASYYPWVKAPNPLYNRDDPHSSTLPRTLSLAPSAFAAGVWSRIDGTRGVWKAPAGVEASLNGAAGLEFTPEDSQQDYLNPRGVNCLRKLPGYGIVVWGGRTLATAASPEWRYVSVRRTAILLEQSIFNGIQWAVFEPNDHRLWSALRLNIASFLDGLFRAGAFQGEKASDAYFVRCSIGDTMTQDDVDRGQLIVVVGFAPLKPAEFVVVRIQQKVQQ